jgi:hypothetical protein
MLSTLSKLQSNIFSHSRSHLHLQSRFFSTLRHSHYDLVIVGGGMVGTTLGVALATSNITKGLKIAVLEAIQPNLNKPCNQNIYSKIIFFQLICLFLYFLF